MISSRDQRRHSTQTFWSLAAEDLRTVRDRDPSILSTAEAILHPGILALWSYRIAHRIHRRGHRVIARLISNLGRVLSGSIEIHPGAQIGRRFFIDHGAGVVIGETAIIGHDVTLFHQVTLGSTGWWRSAAGERRHPMLEDGVIVGANATVLGNITIGRGAVVGAQALVTADVHPGTHLSGPLAEPRRRKSPAATAVPSFSLPKPTEPSLKSADPALVPYPIW